MAENLQRVTVTPSKKQLVQALESRKNLLPSLVQKYIDLNGIENLPTETIKGLIREADLQQYSLMAKRNDPDAMYKNPEISQKDLTGTIWEAVGKDTKPKELYTYTEPSTLGLLVNLGGGQGSYAPNQDSIIYPSAKLFQNFEGTKNNADQLAKETEAHEFMHRGMKNLEINKPTVENVFSKNYLPGINDTDQHLYIFAKANPQRLGEFKERMFPTMDQKAFDSYLEDVINKFEQREQFIRNKKATTQLADMLNNF